MIDDDALFQPDGEMRGGARPHVTAANAGETLVLRVERQTFRRLPGSGVVAFATRVDATPPAEAIPTRDHAGRLAAAGRAIPDAMARYKNIVSYRDPLLAWLDAFNPVATIAHR